MADTEQKPGEMPTTEQEGVTPPATDQQPLTVEQLQAQLADRDKRIRELNRESAERRKKLDQFEAEAKAKADAEMTELEKAQKRAAELEEELARRDLAEKKRAIAAKVGLPDGLALRLVGATDEELEKDAKALLETLPKPEKPKPGATNPGAGGSTGETDVQRKARILGITN